MLIEGSIWTTVWPKLGAFASFGTTNGAKISKSTSYMNPLADTGKAYFGFAFHREE